MLRFQTSYSASRALGSTSQGFRINSVGLRIWRAGPTAATILAAGGGIRANSVPHLGGKGGCVCSARCCAGRCRWVRQAAGHQRRIRQAEPLQGAHRVDELRVVVLLCAFQGFGMSPETIQTCAVLGAASNPERRATRQKSRRSG